MGNKKALVFIVTALAGLFLRWFNPGLKPVSPEEFETLRTALSGGFPEIFFSSLAHTGNPPLFYLIQALFLKAAGVSEFSLRLFPALVSAVSLFVFYKLSRSFFSEKAATIAFIVFAFNPFQFYAGQQAAVYCLAQLSLMLCIYYFLISVKYNAFTFGPFVFWSAVSLYTHHSAVIVLAAMNILMFTYFREEIRPKQWALSQVVTAVLWLPLAPGLANNFIFYQPSGGGSVAAIFEAVKIYTFGPAAPQGWVFWALTAAALWFILMGAVTRRRIMEKKIENAVVFIIAAVLVVPWLLSFATGFFDPYNLIIAAPFIILLFGIGMSYMSEAGMALFMAVFLAAGAYSAVRSHTAKDFLAPDYASAYAEAVKQNTVTVHETERSYAAFEFYALKNKTGADNRVYADLQEAELKGAALHIKKAGDLISSKLKLKTNPKQGKIDTPVFEVLARSTGRITLIKEPGRGVFPYPKGFETAGQKDFRGVRVVLLEKQGGY